MFFRCIFAIFILLSHSYAVAAVQEVSPIESPLNASAPWAIEWNMPDWKDETTPKTLIVCSEHSDEQVRQYRSLIEKAAVLHGYTILDGNKPNEQMQTENSTGYIVFIDNDNSSREFSDCIEKYPNIKTIVTNFIQTNMSAEQKTVQTLLKAGVLPAGTPPSHCSSRFYYSTKDYYPTRGQQQWIAHVGIGNSSDLSCLELFRLGTFGIDPRSCQSAGICH
ncbi:hypothetical protein FHT78_003662 [Rhizobium sp. BK196]|jgi:hypothetical protein|uniref:hypothetical protein n=1 Tax=Rhizobium sp. BK196 TaxID=2587073 RepID=UPI001608521E|nr:hypothetical protein [Rhizobium sp. BK196]MBB3311886.1 hypothetical protein [Rhizobium sp. BK196]